MIINNNALSGVVLLRIYRYVHELKTGPGILAHQARVPEYMRQVMGKFPVTSFNHVVIINRKQLYNIYEYIYVCQSQFTSYLF